MNFHHNLTQQT